MSASVDTTVALTGILPAVLIISAVLTALVTVLLLWLYKRAVIRAMETTFGGQSMAVPSVDEAESAVADPSALMISDAASPESEDAFQRAGRSMRRAGWVYVAGGVLYAVVFSAVWVMASDGGFLAVRFVWLLACFCWPIVPGLCMVAVVQPWHYRVAVGGYFVAVIVIALVALGRSPDATAGQMIYFWLFVNGPATLMLLAFMRRRIRAVGPMVLAFMVLGVAGAMVAIQVVGHNDRLMQGVVAFGAALGLGAKTVFVLIHLMGFGIFSLFGWRLLRWIGNRYQLKKINDQSLTLDAMWLIFGVVQSITLVFENWVWIFTGVVAFVLYKMAVMAGFAILFRQPSTSVDRPSLLLLRVFSLGRRSEALFHMLSKLWLRVGHIRMIAGPDLATTTVEPHEFLDFLGRRLRRRFIQDRAGLQNRLADMDATPDRYGRHRVEEFFCHTDTWKMTVDRLSMGTHAVLMDLRSFSPANQGCQYELQTLLNNVALTQVLLVIDHTTDRDFLEMTLHRLWARLPVKSINTRLADPEVRFFRLSVDWKSQVPALLALLLEISHRRESTRRSSHPGAPSGMHASNIGEG